MKKRFVTLINADDILGEVTKFFLISHDFNGISTTDLASRFGVEWRELHEPLRKLIDADLVGVTYSDVHINPHIIRTDLEPKQRQIDKLGSAGSLQACVYPRPKHLRTKVDPTHYNGKPYELCLALGEPQLEYRSFDLSVLEVYRNDPRYNYENDDVRGKICYNSDGLRDSDRIFLQTFGFSYNENLDRAVAVFICYLARLSSEHQLIWQAKELSGDFKLHPDYYRNAIIGDWGERVPICGALLKELYIINQMASAMGRPPLFHQDFGEYGEGRPPKFGFLIRPTLEEFNNFVLLLDKVLSDNINIEFFQNEVSNKKEVERPDGRIEVWNKGTLQILDEWLRQTFDTADDWQLWEESLDTLKKVRKFRQKPAHALDENVFDQRYIKDQRRLIVEAYSAVRVVRLLIANHPAVQSANIDVPVWLREGRIWTK